MEIRLLEKDNDAKRVSFILKGSNVAFANTLRRIMITEVPTMAIEDVEFRKNNSLLYDEMLAHRLGLVVLKTDLKSYELPEKCSCKGEGCAKCQLKLTLKAKGDKTVYASEIKSSYPKVVPAYPKTVLVQLLKGQDLEFEATAVLGKGKEHMKWSPCLAYYKNKPTLEILKDKFDGMEKVVDQCPLKIFEIKNNKLSINKNKVMECHLCGACEEVSEGKVKVTESKDEFIFFIESWGQLNWKDIIKAANDGIQERVDLFVEKVKTLK